MITKLDGEERVSRFGTYMRHLVLFKTFSKALHRATLGVSKYKCSKAAPRLGKEE